MFIVFVRNSRWPPPKDIGKYYGNKFKNRHDIYTEILLKVALKH
jgi:hypothetical protein